MRRLVFILASIMVHNAYAQDLKIACNTSSAVDLIDTAYTFTETANSFKLKVQYAPGALPLDADATSTTRLRDLKTLEERAELFSRLPNTFFLEFKKENCFIKSNNGNIDWHCLIRDPGQIEDFSFSALSFFVSSRKIESIDGVSKWYSVGFDFKLSFEQLLGKKKLAQMISEATAEERKTLIFNKNYRSFIKTTTVIFENTSEHKSCYIPEFKDTM